MNLERAVSFNNLNAISPPLTSWSRSSLWLKKFGWIVGEESGSDELRVTSPLLLGCKSVGKIVKPS